MVGLAPIYAQKPESQGRSSQPTPGLKQSDKDFIQTAGTGGKAEVKLAEAAVKQGHSSEVKTFAEKLVKDHTAANTELTTLAKTKNIEIPPCPEKEKEKHEALLKKKGADFDAAFLAEMEKCHQKDIALFEKASKEASDADVKAFAAKTLPVLKSHAEMIPKHPKS